MHLSSLDEGFFFCFFFFCIIGSPCFLQGHVPLPDLVLSYCLIKMYIFKERILIAALFLFL